jgi:hypothetical protein
MAEIICQRGIAPERHQLGTVGRHQFRSGGRDHIVTVGGFILECLGDIIGIRTRCEWARTEQPTKSSTVLMKDRRFIFDFLLI